jgi:Bromodomain
MYLTLITERVANNYYRSVDQLFSDLDLIFENSKIYNSDASELTVMAKKVGDGIKKAIK